MSFNFVSGCAVDKMASFSGSIKNLLTPVISVKEMLKKPFGAVLIILQSWNFSKISPKNPGNAISETLDSNILQGSMPPYPPRISRVFGARPPHFEKASVGPADVHVHTQKRHRPVTACCTFRPDTGIIS